MAAPAPLSPLAPKTYPALPPIAGVRFATIAAGVRYSGRTDVMMALFDRPASVAGVFTRSKCPSAPVDWCREHLNGGKARALIVNSGNANAFTGGVGAAAVAHVAEAAAKAIGAAPNEIFMASTGVIGEPLDATRITRVIDTLIADAREDTLLAAAKAIMTTDTYPKIATARVKLGDGEVVINGIAKGAGMIAPDMATMLAYVFTDAAIAPRALQAMLSKSVERSFNAITVDSDTSTSDTLMVFATGAAKNATPIEDAADPRAAEFRRALDKLLRNLAHQVVRDGEGARKFITVKVEGAATRKAAKRIALSIANSPLVKTACGGRGRQLGSRGHGGRQGGREGRARQARHLLRQDPRRPPRLARSRLRRSGDIRLYEAGLDRDHRRSRHRPRARDGVDLRSHEGICRDQWRLSLVKLVLVVAAALIDADGRVLLAQRPKGKALEGLWEFPGGKVDAGEGPEDALIRELMEELGITVKADCLAPLTFASHAYPDFHLLMPLYVCRRWEGFVQPLDGQALKWVRPKDLRSYPMPPADVPLLPHLEELLG